MPFASLVNKTGYKLSIILPLRNTFWKFSALDIFAHWELLSMLEGAPATRPLYHRGPCQARMKLHSNHKTCTNELFKLLTFDKFLVRPYIEDKWAVGFTEHRLDLVDTDVTVFSGLIYFVKVTFCSIGTIALTL